MQLLNIIQISKKTLLTNHRLNWICHHRDTTFRRLASFLVTKSPNETIFFPFSRSTPFDEVAVKIPSSCFSAPGLWGHLVPGPAKRQICPWLLNAGPSECCKTDKDDKSPTFLWHPWYLRPQRHPFLFSYTLFVFDCWCTARLIFSAIYKDGVAMWLFSLLCVMSMGPLSLCSLMFSRCLRLAGNTTWSTLRRLCLGASCNTNEDVCSAANSKPHIPLE